MGDKIIGDYYENLDRISGNYTLDKTFEFIWDYKLDLTFTSLHPNTKD